MAETRIANKCGTFSGTTASTSVYQEVCRFDTRGCGYQGKTYVLIRNTGAAQTLHYKIDGYLVNTNGLAIACRAETSVAVTTTTTDSTAVVMPYGVVIISVKGNSGNTTYTVEYTTY